jgi:GT2 family glycosyltransferase
LDDRLFMYAEDVEWGCRIRDSGYRIAYVPSIEVVHIQHATQPGVKAAPPTRWLDNLRTLHARYSSPSFWFLVRWALAVSFLGRGILYLAASTLTRRDANLSRGRAMWVFARHLIKQPAR